MPRPNLVERAGVVSRAALDVAAILGNAHRTPRPARTPLVSVVVATYNWSSVLVHSVRSALGQRYPNLEVIVVGDGCTDDSEAVLHALGDARVRWENLESNSGHQSAPNNRGLELARGEYVAYLGHDDLWHPDHLGHLVAAVERSGAGLGIASVIAIGPPGSNMRVLMRRTATPSGSLHRRTAVERAGGWRDFRTTAERPDAEFLERIAGVERVALSRALTVWKFNSAWRQNSYVERRADEQAEVARRIARERLLVEREVARWLWFRLRRPETNLPELDPVPDVVPPGWHVRQFRRIRGLPEEPDG